MKKNLIFAVFFGTVFCAAAECAVRDGAAGTRTKATQQSAIRGNGITISRTAKPTETTQRTVAPIRSGIAQTRAGVLKTTSERGTTTRNVRGTIPNTGTRIAAKKPVGRAAIARATDTATTETRTGAAYTQCKNAYFQCMDQFCQLKNDDYRRCSCSDRIYDITATRTNLTETNAKLTEFKDSLDIVGMTPAQATAIRTASEGENALTADTSASKALLNAIMNSIRGEDTNVSGKLTALNSINIPFDTSNAFGTADGAQMIASYNGTNLYKAVYTSCRAVVENDCNNASLQRAITAYLMAIEQDCNTVQAALNTKQKELKSAIREGSAMLDLARIENRQKHNSDDKATCIAGVEAAVLSDQVCGENYHKCLDNGEFIDISTGAPIAGVVNFYELANMLTFDYGKNATEQKLAQNPNNRTFVQNFINKTKKFATDALDKCTEIADDVWQEYLDKALLDIYYAQQTKVETIKTGCFDLISSCYSDKEASITAAMSELVDGTNEISLQPNKIILTTQMCSDYIDSCNNMFGADIISNYIAKQTSTDTLAACRAIADQCFTKFGGPNYENFYYPSSGLFTPNTADSTVSENPTISSALDWFSLYEYDENGHRKDGYKSECAKQLAAIDSCVDQIETIFGGLDAAIVKRTTVNATGMYKYDNAANGVAAHAYGWTMSDADTTIDLSKFKNRRLRPTGVATEVYNRIIDTLQTQCQIMDGAFIEAQYIDHNRYGANPHDNGNLCKLYVQNAHATDTEITYGFPRGQCNTTSSECTYCCQSDQNSFIFNDKTYTLYREDVCPKDYALNTDTNAWGACLCWENGGRRSINGLYNKCMPVINVYNYYTDEDDNGHWTSLPTLLDKCQQYTSDTNTGMIPMGYSVGSPNWISWHSHSQQYIYGSDKLLNYWCTSNVNSTDNRVCPLSDQSANCAVPDNVPPSVTKR